MWKGENLEVAGVTGLSSRLRGCSSSSSSSSSNKYKNNEGARIYLHYNSNITTQKFFLAPHL